MSKPRWLIDPPMDETGALRVWKRHAARLWREGRLTAKNVEAFCILCRNLALAERAEAEIEADGATVKAASGTVRAHPAVKIMLDAQRASQPLMTRFGLDGW